MQQFILGSRLEVVVGVDAAKMVNGVIIDHLPVRDYDKFKGPLYTWLQFYSHVQVIL